jgi:hypothetical protein
VGEELGRMGRGEAVSGWGKQGGGRGYAGEVISSAGGGVARDWRCRQDRKVRGKRENGRRKQRVRVDWACTLSAGPCPASAHIHFSSRLCFFLTKEAVR